MLCWCVRVLWCGARFRCACAGNAALAMRSRHCGRVAALRLFVQTYYHLPTHFTTFLLSSASLQGLWRPWEAHGDHGRDDHGAHGADEHHHHSEVHAEAAPAHALR